MFGLGKIFKRDKYEVHGKTQHDKDFHRFGNEYDTPKDAEKAIEGYRPYWTRETTEFKVVKKVK